MLLFPVKIITGILIYIYLILHFIWINNWEIIKYGYKVTESFFLNPILGVINLILYILQILVIPIDLLIQIFLRIPLAYSLTVELFQSNNKLDVLKSSTTKLTDRFRDRLR